VLSTTTSNWVVSAVDPAGACAAAPVSEAVDFEDNPDPRIIQVRSDAESSLSVVLAAGQAAFPFNGLGRLAVVPATNPVIINVTNPAAGTCRSVGGPVRCLRVTVSLGGQVRVCDPALAAPDPQAC
jgi:type IV fimbrial biogenesis protein FimT